jgi:hypothetical protein
MNICGENRHLRQSRNRYGQVLKIIVLKQKYKTLKDYLSILD